MDKPEWGVGSKKGAVWGFIKEFFPIIILPIILFALIGWLISGSNVDMPMDDYNSMIRSAAIFSIPLIIMAIPLGYYAKGNSARIPFAFFFPVYAGIWILLFTNGGNLPLSLPGMDVGTLSISSMDVVLDIKILIYIMMFVCFLKGLMAFTEYSANRKKFQEKLNKGSL